MIVVNVAEAKAKLSEYLDAVVKGERVLISKHNRPIAELRAVESVRAEPRPIGLARGAFTVPDSFFEPLPDDVVADFYPLEDRTHGKVAEGTTEPYTTGKRVKGERKR
jgi:prevent-host-death family protein